MTADFDPKALGILTVSTMAFQPQAVCYQCRWKHGPSVLTEARAAKHSKDRRHLVRVWTEHVWEYAPDLEVAAAERRVIPLPGQEDDENARPSR